MRQYLVNKICKNSVRLRVRGIWTESVPPSSLSQQSRPAVQRACWALGAPCPPSASGGKVWFLGGEEMGVSFCPLWGWAVAGAVSPQLMGPGLRREQGRLRSVTLPHEAGSMFWGEPRRTWRAPLSVPSDATPGAESPCRERSGARCRTRAVLDLEHSAREAGTWENQEPRSVRPGGLLSWRWTTGSLESSRHSGSRFLTHWFWAPGQVAKPLGVQCLVG